MKSRRKSVGIAILVIFLAPFLILFAGCTALAGATAFSQIRVVEVPVPDIVGMRGDEADKALSDAGLQGTFDSKEGLVILKENWRVTEQSPKPGKTISSKENVRVTVARIEKAIVTPSPSPSIIAPQEPQTPIEPVVPPEPAPVAPPAPVEPAPAPAAPPVVQEPAPAPVIQQGITRGRYCTPVGGQGVNDKGETFTCSHTANDQVRGHWQ